MYHSTHEHRTQTRVLDRREVSRIARWAVTGLLVAATLPFVAYGLPRDGISGDATAQTSPTADIITFQPLR